MAETFSLIAIEEHFLSDHLPDDGNNPAKPPGIRDGTKVDLREIGEYRLKQMKDNSIGFTVISHMAANASASVCHSINSELYKRIKPYPTHFAAFGILSMYDPLVAATELRRCVNDLKFAGALIPTHLPDGTFYDTEKYHAVFEAAQQLDVPIYLHPTTPSGPVKEQLFDGPYHEDVATALSQWCGGFHYINGLHLLRLFASGLFDNFPRLKIIIGHTGEFLPFMLDRIVGFTKLWPNRETRKRGFDEVWNSNIWITTSGSYDLSPMATVLRVTKIERVIFSVDYPMGSNVKGREFMENLRKSDLVTEAQWERIAFRNAQELLGLGNIQSFK
ncbi:hypothetical protein NM208_g5444 [Fusarium decemcellulare]|uniref:Uncharacterized protein n=1 Tax=Fusarium decemcellulare TaxID=57161 RepID=A0ACC1SH96_9HYPO|nr:hypothetical protein NM208_g5444 [Fusarium decemcellulare]